MGTKAEKFTVASAECKSCTIDVYFTEDLFYFSLLMERCYFAKEFKAVPSNEGLLFVWPDLQLAKEMEEVLARSTILL